MGSMAKWEAWKDMEQSKAESTSRRGTRPGGKHGKAESMTRQQIHYDEIGATSELITAVVKSRSKDNKFF